MKKRFWIFLGMGITSYAQAQDALLDCAGISSDADRLACFDSIVETMSSPVNDAEDECPNIDLIDLKLDAEKLMGECVTTEGQLMSLGEMVMLSDGLMDMTPVTVEISALSRTERKMVLECTQCRLVVRGTVSTTIFGDGLIASQISQP